METRDIVLSLLIVSVGAAIFYMLDPTLGGVIKASVKREGFANSNAPVNYNNVIPASDSNMPGMNQPGMNNANGAYEAEANNNANHAVNNNTGAPAASPAESTVEGFETLTPAPMPFKDAEKPSNCYPKDQINPSELLPNDPNSKWAQVNPMGQGDIAGKNYLSAGALIGVNTIGQSLRNANYQLRSDPPNPQVKVSIWNQSTIEPDVNRRALEIS
jgi:hypothetical protein